MKTRTSLVVVAVVVAASWWLPSARTTGLPQAGHEFLVGTASAAPAVDHAAARIEPVQLALLFQLNGR